MYKFVNDTSLDPHEIEEALRTSRYGNFHLTEALRVFGENANIPFEGYKRIPQSKDGQDYIQLIISLSEENIFDIFSEFLDFFEVEVDLFLYSSHGKEDGHHSVFHRTEIDSVVLRSYLLSYFEDLQDDGNAGLAVREESTCLMIQLDEHKLMYVFANSSNKLVPFINILADHRISHNQSMKFVVDGPHIHLSSAELRDKFDNFCQVLGAVPLDL